jgi:hypothetical protein
MHERRDERDREVVVSRGTRIGGRREIELAREYEKARNRGIIALFERITLCNTQPEVDASITIARLLNHEGIREDTSLLYFVLLETNNGFVIDELIGKRDPFLLFSALIPNGYMLGETFRLMSRFKRDEICEKLLLVLLGIIQNGYKASKAGFRLFSLSVSDVYNIGKYLDKKKDQLHRTNRLILDILFDIYNVGINNPNQVVKEVALTANGVRMSYFDNRKDMSDVIPDVLLLKTDYVKRQVKPGIHFGGRGKKT